MPVTTLHEIRIMPGVTIARLGSSPSPMDNYDTLVEGSGFRRLEPAESLVVNPRSGEITASVTPPIVRFRDAQGRIRPVCPFLELWGRFDNDEDLRPITKQDLSELNLATSDVQWSISLGGLKIFRRTGDPGDRITANLSADKLVGHEQVELQGKCDNFKTETTKITMGWIQYIKPTDDFPEIRVRFTPPQGLVYGHREVAGIIPPERAVYDAQKGRWDTYEDASAQPNNPTARARLWTTPGGIYARSAPDVSGNRFQLGYFDDVGDAILSVSLPGVVGAKARIAVGPPDFAPDSYATRTVEDDLQQMAKGPTPADVSAEDVIDVVRRAVETMRLMNTEVGNDRFLFWVPSQLPVFDNPASVHYSSVRARHEGILSVLEGLKQPANHPDRVAAHAALQTLANILRDYDRAADYESDNMKRMPAMMRDASSHMLTLTRRQINSVRIAVEKFKPDNTGSNDPITAMRTMITAFSWAAALHSNINTHQGMGLDAIFDNPDLVMEHLTTGEAQGNDAVQLGIQGDPLVISGDPDGSAIVKLVTKPDHAMHPQLSGYRGADGTSSGIDILRNWIASL